LEQIGEQPAKDDEEIKNYIVYKYYEIKGDNNPYVFIDTKLKIMINGNPSLTT